MSLASAQPPPARPRPSVSAPSDLVFGAALFALAWAVRLYVAFRFAGEPVWDGHYYDFGARRIAAGLGYSDDLTIGGHLVWHPWCHYPVGYSAFLAFFYRVFGDGPHVAPAVNASVGAALALVTWGLARHGLSPLRARLAGLLVALHPGLVLYSALVMTEPLAALLTLLAFLLAVRDPRPMRGVVLGALTLGVAALVRPQALLCAPFLALSGPSFRAPLSPAAGERGWGLGGGRRLVHTTAVALAACAIALLPVLPWTARNCRVMDGCALVSTNGGWNLAIGAFPRATGRFETLRSSDGCREVTGQVQQDRCWLAYGLGQIRAAPARWLGLVPAKLGFTFDHESFAVEYLHQARPEVWPDARRAAARDALTMVQRILVLGAALGCVAFRVRGLGAVVQGGLCAGILLLAYLANADGTPTFWPLVLIASIVPWLPLPGRAAWKPALLMPVALLGTTVLTHAVFFGEDRYHVVVTPVLCLLAAGAFRAPFPLPPFPRRRGKGPGVGGFGSRTCASLGHP